MMMMMMMVVVVVVLVTVVVVMMTTTMKMMTTTMTCPLLSRQMLPHGDPPLCFCAMMGMGVALAGRRLWPTMTDNDDMVS
jgi:hypothetical protein